MHSAMLRQTCVESPQVQTVNCKLDFLTYEDGVNSLSQNFGKELPLYAV